MNSTFLSGIAFFIISLIIASFATPGSFRSTRWSSVTLWGSVLIASASAFLFLLALSTTVSLISSSALNTDLSFWEGAIRSMPGFLDDAQIQKEEFRLFMLFLVIPAAFGSLAGLLSMLSDSSSTKMLVTAAIGAGVVGYVQYYSIFGVIPNIEVLFPYAGLGLVSVAIASWLLNSQAKPTRSSP